NATARAAAAYARGPWRNRATALSAIAMQRFRHDGVEIAFFDEGQGKPIVLVHGFASTAQVNWVYPGWVTSLTDAGPRVIAFDDRGHGTSTKLYDPAAYRPSAMAGDVRTLLDHLGLDHRSEERRVGKGCRMWR